MLRDRRGAIAIPATMAFAGLMAAAGMAVEIGYWRTEGMRLQKAVDFAALAAASAIARGENDQIAAVIDDVLARNELVPRVGSGVTFQSPPSTGDLAGNDDAVAVAVSSTYTPMLTRFISTAGVTLDRQAEAMAGAMQPGCMIALDTGSTDDALTFNSIVNVDLWPCVPVSNSTSANSIKIGSMIETFRAGSLYTSGDVAVSSAVITLDEPEQTGENALPDPFATLPAPPVPACNYNNFTGSGTLMPGVYCGDTNFVGDTVLQPGTYYIVAGNLSVSSATSITCNCSSAGAGVTFVLTASVPADIGIFNFGTIDTIDLRAPSDLSYDYPGILIYVDRRAPYDKSEINQINTVMMNGAIYAPSQEISFNSIDATLSDCALYVGLHLTFNSIFGFGTTSSCTSYGTKSLSISAAGAVSSHARLAH